LEKGGGGGGGGKRLTKCLKTRAECA